MRDVQCAVHSSIKRAQCNAQCATRSLSVLCTLCLGVLLSSLEVKCQTPASAPYFSVRIWHAKITFVLILIILNFCIFTFLYYFCVRRFEKVRHRRLLWLWLISAVHAKIIFVLIIMILFIHTHPSSLLKTLASWNRDHLILVNNEFDINLIPDPCS